MSPTLDLAGLAPDSVRVLESLAGLLRERDAAARPSAVPSVFDVFGKAERLLSREETDRQIAEERAAWAPIGAPAFGRGKGKLIIISEDDEHLAEFEGPLEGVADTCLIAVRNAG